MRGIFRISTSTYRYTHPAPPLTLGAYEKELS
jgi:hypothetical protein